VKVSFQIYKIVEMQEEKYRVQKQIAFQKNEALGYGLGGIARVLAQRMLFNFNRKIKK